MAMLVRLAAAVAVMTIVPAHAADDAIATSRSAILAGDMAGAEHALDAERRIFPDRQDVLLNLAAVYASSGRVREAAALYQRVLDRRDVVMDVDANRTSGAHAVANRGLSRIARLQTASR